MAEIFLDSPVWKKLVITAYLNIVRTYLLICLLVKLFVPRSKSPTQIILSLTYDQIFQNDGINFVKFISQDRFSFTCPKKVILIEIRRFYIPRLRTKNLDLIISRDLATYIFLKILNWSEIFSIFKLLFYPNIDHDSGKSFFQNLKFIKSENFDQVIWNNFNKFHNFQGDLITTQTSLTKLPSYFRPTSKLVNRVMIWYSLNSNVISRKYIQINNKYISREILEFIDEHYIWNYAQMKDLEIHGISRSKLKVVGSIVFLPIKTKSNEIKHSDFITYFDITPYQSKDNFYSYNLVSDTLDLILSAINSYNMNRESKLVLRVKPKRYPHKLHSKKYLKLLESLEKSNQLQLLRPDSNLYNCIEESRAVLALPYSSPVFIAEEFGIPNTFVFADNLEWNVIERHGIEIQRNVGQLTKWFEQRMNPSKPGKL